MRAALSSALTLVLNFLRALGNPVRSFRGLKPGKQFLLAAWTIIAALFAAVMHFTTGAGWVACAFLAVVMAGFSGGVGAVMCRWSDQRAIARTRLIIFFGIGLVMMLLTIVLKGSRLDPTSVKLFIFSLAGLVVTAFFMPKSSPSGTAGAASN